MKAKFLLIGIITITLALGGGLTARAMGGAGGGPMGSHMNGSKQYPLCNTMGDHMNGSKEYSACNRNWGHEQ